MPDISMCFGKGCSFKNFCYRHRAIPTPRRQAYQEFTATEQSCPDFMPIGLRKIGPPTELDPSCWSPK